MNTSDMLTHPWILTETNEQFQKFKLNLRELLSVSSDWKDVNKKYNNTGSNAAGGLPVDF